MHSISKPFELLVSSSSPSPLIHLAALATMHTPFSMAPNTILCPHHHLIGSPVSPTMQPLATKPCSAFHQACYPKQPNTMSQTPVPTSSPNHSLPPAGPTTHSPSTCKFKLPNTSTDLWHLPLGVCTPLAASPSQCWPPHYAPHSPSHLWTRSPSSSMLAMTMSSIVI